MRRIPMIAAAVVLVALLSVAPSSRAAEQPGDLFSFRTFFVTWVGNGTPEMFDYLEQARPEVVQVGFYGPQFHGYAHHPKSTGYPMQLPIAGEREALARQTEINRRIHEILPEAKVVGHFQFCNVIDNPAEPYGFIKWYDTMWDENLLGPKPVDDARELLQRDATGAVIHSHRYIDFIGLCISSPHTQTMMKRMVSVAIDAGCDGLVSNYNYRWGCVCHWCQDAFKDYLRNRYDADALAQQFGIGHLDTHTFDEIPAKIPGYPKDATPLALAAMDWGARHFKQVFDDVYITHGRSIKPDFVVGTWNHLGTVSHTEERAFTPLELWGKGENYFWYSGSHAGKDKTIANGIVGDASLNLLWLREMSGGKPMMIGKYEQVRVRAAFAEGAALGGAATGLYHPFKDAVGADVMTRYTQFIHNHPDYYRGVTPYAEVGLILPRRSALAGDPEPMVAFRAMGEALADRQVLFDVICDERFDEVINSPRGARYTALVRPSGFEYPVMTREYADYIADAENAAAVADRIAELSPTRITAPRTLRASTFDRPGVRLLHLVNYNRDEAAATDLRGPAAELPIPQRDIKVTLALPGVPGKVSSISLWSPDAEDPSTPTPIAFESADGQVLFTVPEVVVYGVVEVEYE